MSAQLRLPLLLLLLLAVCSYMVPCAGSSESGRNSSHHRHRRHNDSDTDAADPSPSPRPDAAGSAAPGSLPFPLPLPSKESHISSSRHADSLLRSRRLDTSDARRGVWEAVERREETRSFSRWVTAALRHRSLQELLQTTPLWTLFVPSNDAVDSYLSEYLDREPPLSTLLAHLVPNISFVLFDSPRPPAALPLLTASHRPAVTLFLCDTDSIAQCEEETAERYATPTPNAPADADRAFLLRSEVRQSNRVAANGVVHLIDRVLGTTERPMPADDNRKRSAPAAAGVATPALDEMSSVRNSARLAPATPSASSPPSSSGPAEPASVANEPPRVVSDGSDGAVQDDRQPPQLTSTLVEQVDLTGVDSSAAAAASSSPRTQPVVPVSAYWTSLNIALVSVGSFLLLLLSLWGCRHYLHVQSPRLDAAWNAVCCCCPREPDVDFIDFGSVVSPRDRRPLLPPRMADVGEGFSYQAAASRTKQPPDM